MIDATRGSRKVPSSLLSSMLKVFLTIGLFSAVAMFQIPDLDALRWNHRVLILFAPGTNNSQLTQQKQMLHNRSDDLKERDLKVFEISGTSQADEQLRGKFHVKAEAFAIVLIGKDGSQKLKRSQAADPDEIFKLIDSMPMRKNEMRQRQ